MLSSSGSATAAPRPRSIARRDKCIFLINIVTSRRSTRRLLFRLLPLADARSRRFSVHVRNASHLKRLALDDPLQERRPPVVVAPGVTNDLTDCRLVVVLDAAPQAIRKQLHHDRVNELVSVVHQEAAKCLRA